MALALYRLKYPGQHIMEPITFWADFIIQKSKKEKKEKTSRTALALYRVKHPGQHITEPITFWADCIIQKSKNDNN